MKKTIFSKEGAIRQVKDIPSLLAQIRARSPMWLGATTVSGLKILLDGIFLAEDVHNIPEAQRLSGFSFQHFEAWVDENYNARHLAVNSFHLASLMMASEEEAFWRWFEWYDEFREGVRRNRNTAM